MRLPTLLLLPLALAFAGCQSAATRARQHAAEFNPLPPEVQSRLLAGAVAIGDTPAMVEIALGQPQEDQAMLTSRGVVRRTWVYTEKRYMKEGSHLARIDPQLNRIEVADVYRMLNVLKCEIVFFDDRVVHVRDPQREAPALAALK